MGRRLASLSRPLYLIARTAYRAQHNLRGDITRVLYRRGTVVDLNRFERSHYSQGGEDGMLQIIFRIIGTTNKFCVEFGVENGQECNTRYLLEHCGWRGLRMDGGNHTEYIGQVSKEFITAENINSLFAKHSVPKEFDLLSIDIDGNDYWVWSALDGYSPRVVVIEYNSSIPPNESRTVPYHPEFQWDGSRYFGASLLALVKISSAKGYALIGCDSAGSNAFFLRRDLVRTALPERMVEDAYRAPRYGVVVDGAFVGHRPSPKMSQMVEV